MWSTCKNWDVLGFLIGEETQVLLKTPIRPKSARVQRRTNSHWYEHDDLPKQWLMFNQ